MNFSWVFWAAMSVVPAHSQVTLNATRIDHVLVLNDVFLNGDGPFRMMIDTGNASSIICPSVARRLKARAAYAVEHVTPAGNRIVPVVVLDQVRTGAISDQAVEAMVTDSPLPGLDGVLGESWLVRHDYLIDYRNHRIVMDGESPSGGLRTALRTTDGRPIVLAEVDGKRSELVLDSGAATVVLFETGGISSRARMLFTAEGPTKAAEGSAQIAVEGLEARRMKIVRVHFAEPAPGLLPASAFAAVFVSNRQGFVEFVR
jgi:predicted aspartyl protease